MPIRILSTTVKSLAGRRLGTFDVLMIMHLLSGVPLDDPCFRLAIGAHRDGSMVVTPNHNPVTHLM